MLWRGSVIGGDWIGKFLVRYLGKTKRMTTCNYRRWKGGR